MIVLWTKGQGPEVLKEEATDRRLSGHSQPGEFTWPEFRYATVIYVNKSNQAGQERIKLLLSVERG